MSPKMADADWSVALEVFRASLPQRGDKGRNDRLFLEALHYFSVHTIPWRTLPERFGKWNSVWKRFDRLSKAGVFESFFDHLASLSSSGHLVQMFDRPSCAPLSRRPAPKGAGRSGARPFPRRLLHPNPPEDRFRRPSHPIAFDLTGGEKGDAPRFPILLGLGPDVDPRVAVCDKGYASKANRQAARSRAVIAILPQKANEKDKPGFFAKALYRGRARIEQTVGKLKRFKRVALRCEKTKRNFTTIVALAAAFVLVKSVHTA